MPRSFVWAFVLCDGVGSAGQRESGQETLTCAAKMTGTPRRGLPTELLASSEQGLQVSPFLVAAEGLEVSRGHAGHRRSPAPDGQRGSSARLR